MSDDDDFMQESDEDYDFEYEDDDDEDSGDVDIENRYYNAKQMKQSDPEDAISEFLALPGLEEEKGEWGFKGLKQAIKVEFMLAQYSKVAEHYEELLTYVKSAVTRNYSEKSINNMLDHLEKGSQDDAAAKCVEQVYSLTLKSFQNTNNERLWLKTNLKLAKLLLDHKDYNSLPRKLKELHQRCQRPDGTDDPSKGTYSLEIYALEIQMYAATKNNKQLKRLYERALKVRSAVPHPKVMGIIRECGGKMHMSEENWDEAQKDFFESFRNYDEAGSLQRIQVLKYLLLTTMLMKSNINPFDSQETKPYKSDPRIAAMTDLVEAYQRDDLHRYQAVLATNQDLLADPFIAENIDEVTRTMRTKGVVKLIAPYTKVTLQWVADKLKISEPEVEDILSFLIVDGQLSARINQPLRTLAMCWAACDRLANAAEALKLDDRADFWRERAETMRARIEEAAWRPDTQRMSATFGGDDLDASLLQLLDLRFLSPDDPRFRTTLEAVEGGLRRGSYMLRYATEDDFGLPHTAFNVCTFWLIEALHFTGRDADARELFEEMLARCTPAGLLSEDIDPNTGELWGNYPQTYSLVGVINCAVLLSKPWSAIR